MSENISNKPKWLGIDLGTTNTVAAVYNQEEKNLAGNVEVIYVMEANGNLMDSTVFFDKNCNEILVGKQAAEQKSTYPENTISDSKRLMGLTYGEEGVREFQARMRQYKIVNSEGYPAFEIEHNRKTIRQTPVDIAAKVLKKIREVADEWANGRTKFEYAVIAVPLKFGQKELEGTKKAAKLAGFLDVQFVKEPNAAACFSGLKSRRLDGYKMMILDFGGGTLDISILKVRNGKDFKVLAQRGRKWLGGRDLDEAIRKEMLKRIKAQYGYDCAKNCGICCQNCNPNNCRRVQRQMQALLERCERLKINLSSMQKSNISLDFMGSDGRQIQLSRDEYEALVRPLLEEVIETANEAMGDAKLKEDGIQEVQMTGGSCCVPMLMDMLEEFGFERAKIRRLEPMHAVAKGAAIIGAQRGGPAKNSQVPKINLTEICPLSIGVKTCDDLFQPVIRRGNKIPHLGKHTFNTTHNDQESITLEIYEGERKLASENNFLGSLTINNLSEGAAGSVQIKLKLSINENGIMRGWAEHKNSLAMMNANYAEMRVDPDDVKEKIKEAETHLLSDSCEEKRIKKKYEFIEAIERAKYKCTDSSILGLCAQFENWLEENDEATFEEFDSKMRRFNALANEQKMDKKLRMRTEKTIKKKKREGRKTC